MAKNTGLTAIFQRRIRALRIEKGWSQAKLGEVAGLSSQYISLLERGERHASLQILEALANALEVTPVSLIQADQKAEKVPSRAAAVKIAIDLLSKYAK